MQDAFQWLEELHSKESLEWVEAQNLKTLAEWTRSDRFASMRSLALHLLSEKNRLTMGTVYRDHVYHLWKDAENPLGLWRKAHLASLKRGGDWFPLLDLAHLSRQKGVETILSQALFLNQSSRVLLSLCPQGKDVREIKEWDLDTGDFVEDGFQAALSKDDMNWVDQDHVLWSRTEKPTHCGYASQVFSWRRGQQPELIFEASESSMAAGSVVLTGTDGKPQSFIFHWLTWDNTQSFYWQDGNLLATGFPLDAWLCGMYQDRVVLWLKSRWENFPAGSVIITKKAGRFSAVTAKDFEFVFESTDTQTFQDLAISQQGIAVFYSDYLRNQIRIWRNGASEETNVPDGFTVMGVSSSVEKDRLFTSFQSFTEPPAWYQWQDQRWQCLQTSARQFNPVNVQCKHEWAVSKDGTRVPYWVVFRDDQPLPKPTIQLGYGGFLTSQFPTYSALIGSLWIEQGGAFVLTQIRGGGELGVSWHDAAIKEHKQKSYDDFIAISEDLIAKGYTTPKQLAIRGRSNGGLLVGATITQRPDLYGAALIEVPLLDMIRYVELPPGSSWIDEFGDPRDPKMREIILKYSPYQNIERHSQYPPILIRTARSDDRVHPGHARKMAAKFQSLGHQVWFFEEELGGHGSTPIPEQAFQTALIHEFFWRTLTARESGRG